MADLTDQASTLADQVKRKCHITWDDEITNQQIEEIMERADAELRDRLGISDEEFDFGRPSREKNLFINWCYYAYNDAEDMFESNFFGDLMQVRRKWEVNDAIEEKA